jgi:glycine/sarcosine N-methyltransferase
VDASSAIDFYDGLAPDYHLLYGDAWDDAVARQGAALVRIIRAAHPGASADVLDCACGIGTQAIGLARCGYRVQGTDISATALERARAEAARLGAAVSFARADLRDLSTVAGTFDVVLCCDNALPHLLAERDVRQALCSMHAKLRPGGLLVVTVRDYERHRVDRLALGPTVLIPGPPRRLLLRLHEWEAPSSPLYTIRLVILTETADGWTVREHAARQRAIVRAELARAAVAAGFEAIAWGDDEIVRGQPVLTARRPASVLR